eukprot:6206976-Pleurochrysis_carterae.AAC.3
MATSATALVVSTPLNFPRVGLFSPVVRGRGLRGGLEQQTSQGAWAPCASSGKQLPVYAPRGPRRTCAISHRGARALGVADAA